MRRRLTLALLISGPALAQEDELSQLMRSLAAVRERRDRFTEERAIPELDLPLPNEGTLSWSAPDRLEKHTLSPIDERLTVSGGRLLYERRDRDVRREFSLADQPEMQALVEAIRGTLAGDLPALRRHYEVALEGRHDDAWRLVLRPTSMRIRASVQRILVTGQGAQPTGVDTEGHGGVTRMRIRPGP
ncbi:outer membrane lipoprotein carrier protein LolA [Roseococcus sp. SYP-B2431]|uniref:LolA family protein n=1 Tax=Roseococcus sp. SYP-B2431 TaxID=2496640 RepID=UPI00103FAC56|nr:LolA-related protein [Roseococcus sp. SYP-B2431]TCH98015.1 outer membrane lipoprotein carrier protein LolA [Roseococcus sp. SYP-B2431]